MRQNRQREGEKNEPIFGRFALGRSRSTEKKKKLSVQLVVVAVLVALRSFHGIPCISLLTGPSCHFSPRPSTSHQTRKCRQLLAARDALRRCQRVTQDHIIRGYNFFPELPHLVALHL